MSRYYYERVPLRRHGADDSNPLHLTPFEQAQIIRAWQHGMESDIGLARGEPPRFQAGGAADLGDEFAQEDAAEQQAAEGQAPQSPQPLQQFTPQQLLALKASAPMREAAYSMNPEMAMLQGYNAGGEIVDGDEDDDGDGYTEGGGDDDDGDDGGGLRYERVPLKAGGGAVAIHVRTPGVPRVKTVGDIARRPWGASAMRSPRGEHLGFHIGLQAQINPMARQIRPSEIYGEPLKRGGMVEERLTKLMHETDAHRFLSVRHARVFFKDLLRSP